MKYISTPLYNNTKKYNLKVAFTIIFFALSNCIAFGQSVWNNATSTQPWGTAGNWTPSGAPGTTAYAQFGDNPTGLGYVDMKANAIVGGIEVTSGRTTIPLSIGVAGSGGSNTTLTLNGATINTVANTILTNNSGLLLSLVPTVDGGNKNMNIVLGTAANPIINIGGTGGITISSVISGAGKNLNKTGAGSGELTLSGLNTYDGGTTITAGTLTFGLANTLPGTGNVTLAGGTLKTGATAGFGQAATARTLALTASSTIALGTGAHTLTFTASNGVSWTAATTLNITGWTGNAGTAGTGGRIFVGTTNGGLTAGQLSQITFAGAAGAMLLTTGELVPRPTISGFGASSGCVGSSITINGTNFTGATAGNVTIGGTPVSSITSNTGTQIVAVIGAGTSTGTVSVTVGAATGTSAASFTIINVAFTWVGSTTAWETGTNWCGGAVPTSTSNVIIPSGSPQPTITTGTTASVLNINIQSGATLTVSGTGILRLFGAITNSGTLNMTDGKLDLAAAGVSVGGSSFSTNTIKDLTISAGGATSIASGGSNNLNVTGFVEFTTSNNTFSTNDNLTLISNASVTASIKDRTANGTLTGDTIIGKASVQRFIPAGRKYRFIAVNTKGTAPLTVQNSWMEGQTPGVGVSTGFGLWVTGNGGTGQGFDANTLQPTFKWWNGTAYIGITNPTTYDIRTKTAYMVFGRGDRSAQGITPNGTTTVLRTSGTLAQGNTDTTAIPAGSNYIQIGNPYASAVDLTKLTYSDNGAAAINIKVWDPNLAAPLGFGAFQTLTKAGGGNNFSITPGGGSYGIMGSTVNTIESGQAFFIQGSGSSRNISFNERAKTPKLNNVFRIAGQEGKILGVLSERLASNVTTVLDGLMVHFDPAYNTAADPDDARKLDNANNNIAVKKGGELLTVEYRNEPAADDTVQINMANMQVKDYRWTFTLENMDEPGRSAHLEDLYLGTSTLLDLNGIITADFSVTADAASSAANRFRIVFKPASVLPVNITGISANRKTDGNIDVKWQAENELNIAHYETERSGDGRTFRVLGNTAPSNNAGGSAGYLYTDVNPLSTDNYYRISAVGSNGSIQKTAIVKVSSMVKEGMISINPNVITGMTVSVHFEHKAAGKYTLDVINTAGQKVYTEQVNLQSNNEVKQITLRNKLAAGVYQLVVTSAEGKRVTIQIVSE